MNTPISLPKRKKLRLIISLLFIILGIKLSAQDIKEILSHKDIEGAIKVLQSDPSQINVTSSTGTSILMLAVTKQGIEAVKYLLKLNADPNLQDKYGRSALHFAAENTNATIVQLLITHGANINIQSPVFGTPLHRATFFNRTEIIKLLLDAKADISASSRIGQALNIACLRGFYESTKLLIKNGADVNQKDPKGNFPLYYAISSGNDSKEMISEILINAGAQTNLKLPNGQSLIELVTRQGYFKTARKILQQYPALICQTNKNKQSLLHLAAIKGYTDLVKLYLRSGIDPCLKDGRSKTAFDYARYYGHIKTGLELYTKMNSNRNIPNTYNYDINTDLKPGQALIWALQNRGWAIKTRHHFFIFDNENRGRPADQPRIANGFLNQEEMSGLNKVALYSTYHGTGTDQESIHKMEGKLSNFQLIHYKRDQWRGGQNTIYLLGQDSIIQEKLKIYAFETIDEYGMGSLGYLIQTDELSFYYSGFLTQNEIDSQGQINFLKSKNIHCDFIIHHYTKNQEERFKKIVQQLKPMLVVPRANLNHANDFNKLSETIKKLDPDISLFVAQNPGDRYFFRKSNSNLEN